MHDARSADHSVQLFLHRSAAHRPCAVERRESLHEIARLVRAVRRRRAGTRTIQVSRDWRAPSGASCDRASARAGRYGEAAHVELSIGYPFDIRCLPPRPLDVRCLPPLRLDVAGAVLRHLGNAERSSTRHSSQRSHAGRPVSSSAPEVAGRLSSLARLRRLVDDRVAGGLRWAAFGGRLARSSKSRQPCQAPSRWGRR